MLQDIFPTKVTSNHEPDRRKAVIIIITALIQRIQTETFSAFFMSKVF